MSNRNSPAETPPGWPSALPLAVITVSERGTMAVSYDGHAFPPPTPDASWSRTRFGDLLDAISDHRKHTVRVEVHEFDGSVFTDIIHAARRERAIAEDQPPSATRRARHRPMRQLIEVNGAGFIPGEDVTVALSVSSAEGSAEGTARAVIDVSNSRITDRRYCSSDVSPASSSPNVCHRERPRRSGPGSRR
ncbi:hypothetical protein [Microbacterium sp. CH12i]|uniref:hypothetical protein n=1 Tax=Microbacterium sp. CH12i TaxID=1479651 RepID=UPI0012691B45|nr:hypothetical protein [Microbacterium sp. CH12i]